jgi:leucyl/phenylalanyl-tRNA---protein transferase
MEPDTLLYAYAHGMFPMKADGDLWWWSPCERGIIPLDGFHVSRSLRKSARRFTCTVNTSFLGVMRGCASSHDDGNWIDDDFLVSYAMLHAEGHAHSVEVWNASGELVGGVYGVRVNNFFAGESMFHTETDASKVALMHLVDLMRLEGMALLDTQWLTDHLRTLGGIAIPRSEYLRQLGSAVAG